VVPVSSRNPFEEIERLFERLSRQFEEAARDAPGDGPLAEWRPDASSMAVDLVERDGEFEATVDLPGFAREDVDVRVTDRELTVAAEHEEATETGEEDEEGRYLRHERRRESTRRSVRLPEAVDTAAVTARMNNGVLTVTLPKSEADAGRPIEVS
jgi:HSP20 family protein